MISLFSRKRASTLALAISLATGSAVVAVAVLPAEASAQRVRERERELRGTGDVVDRIAPPDLKISDARDALAVVFDDGRSYTLPAEMLRVMSPSAEVQGHSPEQRVTLGGKRNVKITELRPVGNYAVRIVFDDRHDTGLFAWSYLDQLGREREQRWATYLDELKAKGLSR